MSYLSLKIFKQGHLLKTKIFTDDQISIGSSEGLSLQLDGISPWHVLIEKKHDIFCILDLDSETGTVLNGQKLRDETPLSSGSLIKIGPYEIQFFIGPPSQSADDSQKSSAQSPAPAQPAVPSFQSETELNDKPVDQSSTEGKSSAFPEKGVESVPPQGRESYRPSKKKKGFWGTYAPLSKIQNLDHHIEPSVGNLIEVLICWKERVLSTHHFFKGGDIFMGGEKDCHIKFPNMLGQSSYKLLRIASGAKVYLSHGIRGALFQGRDKATRTSQNLSGDQTVVLKPYEMVRLDFSSSLKVYVRLMDKPGKPPFAGLLNLKLSEAMALFLAFLLTGLLVFYGTLYAPAFLAKDTEFVEKDIRIAKVLFTAPQKKVIEYKIDVDKKTGPKISNTPVKVKKPRSVKKVKTTKAIPKKTKPRRTPRKSKPGTASAQAPGKNPKKKVSAGSVRPGGSLKTGKKGASAKTVAPDPTKTGLLSVFGGGGKLSQLDKGASGSGGGLLGLAEQSTGYAGTEESYGGEGIGTKTKDLGSGGKGSALVAIGGIKTKGKGLGNLGKGTGGLGKRGRMSIEFGTDDIDVAGEIDRGAILEALRRNQNKFQRCYQMSLNDQPSIEGNLSMQWLIASSGRGRQARAINNRLGSKSLANCVANVLESLNFSQPPSGQTPKVTFTFRFYL